MKIRSIFTLLPFVTFLAMSGVVCGEEKQICQPEVIVFFGNGVWNDVESADKSRRLLQKELETYIVSERKRTFCKSARAIFSLPRDHFKI